MDTDTFVAGHGAEISAARERLAGRIRRTPALTTDLDERVVLKAESLQVTGAFKVRGAFNAILRLRERLPSVHAVCTVSSGNHAQAVAYAARSCGLHAVIVIPEGASPLKIAATRALGAEVVTEGVTFDNRDDFTAALAADRGIPIVHPFDDWDVIHGQGTVGLELVEECPDVEAIVTPVGGGGLLTGIALAVRSRGWDVKLVGVEPAKADDANRSFTTGRLERLAETPSTIADGVRVRSIGERNFEVLVQRGLATAMVTVTEEQIRSAVAEIWRLGRLVVEPTGALPVAAFRAGVLPVSRGGRVALVLTGGNADPTMLSAVVNPAGAS